MKAYDRTLRFGKVSRYLLGGALSSLLLFSSNFSFSQEEYKRNPYIYTKNRFSIDLVNGMNRANFTPQTGSEVPRSPIGLTHQLDFEYTFSLGDNFGVSLGAGFGFFPFMYRIDPAGGFSGTSGWGYIHLVDYNLVGNLDAGFNYQRWIGDRYAFKASAGGGIIKASQWGVTIGGFGQEGLDYQFKFDYDGRPKPFFYLKSGIDRVLKNDDLLGLSLGYRHISNPLYEGGYVMQNYTSTGLMENKKHLFELSLSYTFTRARKMKKAEDFVYQEDLSFKDAKKKFRKEKRYIDPKSVFIGVSSGLFFGRNQVKRDVDFLRSQGTPSWIVQGDVEMGMDRNNLFMQFGFSVAEYWDVIRVDRPYAFGWFATNAFISPTLSAGMGIRLIGKNNINYLNASAGVALGFNFSQKGMNGWGSQNASNSQTGDSYYLAYTDHDVGHFLPTLYLDLSRDFQLSRAVYLSLDYRVNLGFVNVHEKRVEFYETPDLDTPQEAVVGIKGTSNAFQIGIKYKFVPKGK